MYTDKEVMDLIRYAESLGWRSIAVVSQLDIEAFPYFFMKNGLIVSEEIYKNSELVWWCINYATAVRCYSKNPKLLLETHMNGDL